MLRRLIWRRTPGFARLALPLRDGTTDHPLVGTDGLALVLLVRRAEIGPPTARQRVKAISVFLVNNRHAMPERHRADAAFAFQAMVRLTLKDNAFVPRPDPKGLDSQDWDARVGDLHYADVAEIAVGHNVAGNWPFDEDRLCRDACTVWMPHAMVPRVEPNRQIPGIFGMETLGNLGNAAAAKAALSPLPLAYRDWIAQARGQLGHLLPQRRLVADELLNRSYVNMALRVEANLFVAYFKTQRTGQTPHSPKNCLPGNGWTETLSDTINVTVPGRAEPIEVNRYLVSKGENKSIVVYWYQSRDRVVASEYRARFYTAADAIRFNRTDTSMVRVVVPVVDGDDKGATDAAIDFVKDFFVPLRQHFPA